MSARFKILCALADAAGSDLTDAEAERICRQITRGKEAVPIKEEVFVLQQILNSIDNIAVEAAAEEPPHEVVTPLQLTSRSQGLYLSQTSLDRGARAQEEFLRRQQIAQAQKTLQKHGFVDVQAPLTIQSLEEVTSAKATLQHALQ